MNIKLLILFSLLGLIVSFTSGPYAAERLYKIIDKNGNVSYQDRPPIDAKSTVMEKSFETGTDRVRPKIPSVKPQSKLDKSGQNKQLEQQKGNGAKTAEGLSAEELTAIATETPTGNSTDGPGNEVISDGEKSSPSLSPESTRDER